MLENRDYTLIIDKSGSMSTKDRVGGPTRWQIMQESALALANKCEELDPDVTQIFRRHVYEPATAASVKRKWVPDYVIAVDFTRI